MEGAVGRRGCKPGVAIGGEKRAMLNDMDFGEHPLLRTRVNSSRDSLPGQEDGQRVQRGVRPAGNRRRTDLEGEGALRIPEQSTKCLNHPHIELASRFAPELLERFRGRTLRS